MDLKRYLAYLKEPSVRASHDYAIDWFLHTTHSCGKFPNVVELGGAGEYHTYGKYSEYMGVNLENPAVPSVALHGKKSITDVVPFTPRAFVSLFQIELLYPPEERYKIYASIFRRNPGIFYGLSSGFYHGNRSTMDQTLGQNGTLVHQTIQPKGSNVCIGFYEIWLSVRAPSKTFGSDVVEVWKVLISTKKNRRWPSKNETAARMARIRAKGSE